MHPIAVIWVVESGEAANDPKQTFDPEGVRFSRSGIMTEACNSDL